MRGFELITAFKENDGVWVGCNKTIANSVRGRSPTSQEEPAIYVL